MNVKILQENLAYGLNLAERFISPRPQLPILNNFLFTTDQGKLKISATNLDLGIILWLGGVVEKEGSLAIPAHEITEFVSFLPAGEISLEGETTNLKIISSKAEAIFTGANPQDFPQIPQGEEKTSFSLNCQQLSLAVSQVSFAATIDEARPVLEGILWRFDNQGYQMVATDGYRLSLKKIKEKFPFFEKEISFLVPGRSLVELVRLVQEEQLKVSWDKQQSQLVFILPNLRLSSRLLSGDFPDYQRIIPQETKIEAFVDKEELLSAIKIASVFARQAANVIILHFNNDQLEIKTEAAQVGQNKTVIPARFQGEEIKIAFNYRFLLDFLNSIDKNQAEVVIKINDPLSPVLFAVNNDPSLVHLIMPIRTEG